MIVINYGTDWSKTAYGALAASDIGKFLQKEFSVALKPNLVVEKHADSGATTHPEMLDGIILFLKDFGIKNISIMENSAAGHSAAKAFKVCGYEELSKKRGVKLIDLQNDKTRTIRCEGIDIKICETVLNADFFINAPVLKAHSQTIMTCCMKNLKGCIPQSEMRRFHTLGLHKPIAVLNAIFSDSFKDSQYCVVDNICGDLSFEEGGSPVEVNRIIAGQNPVLVDSFCVRQIGFKEDDIDYISTGRRLGAGEYFTEKTKTVVLNGDNKPVVKMKCARIAEQYKNMIEEDSACSVCYASLVFALHRKGALNLKNKKICIGQGFKGKTSGADVLGIGKCAKGFKTFVDGCPAKAADIIAAL
ncbi:MAG: DUF362 domain-containing protein [Treponema sp.]|nr:DUF362 domain-containing protein [Treponema sp.]